jgi:prepilin-type N-terminal cleavage/methylation domain-containing protein
MQIFHRHRDRNFFVSVNQPRPTERFQSADMQRQPFSAVTGFTLVELLIAVFLVTMISAMIYSVLHVGITFSHKGETRLLSLAREQGFLSLLHQQINSVLYNQQRREVEIYTDDESLRLITKRPLMYRDVDVVLAIYRFNASDRTVYYIEKKDFYNPDFDQDYLPDFGI